jgi:hypothetical protein
MAPSTVAGAAGGARRVAMRRLMQPTHYEIVPSLTVVAGCPLAEGVNPCESTGRHWVLRMMSVERGRGGKHHQSRK